MTRLNLSEACLLEASGELGSATRQRLYAHMEKHPEAQRQFEQIKRDLSLLRSIPKRQMTEETRQKLATSIKAGIRKKLRQIEREELSCRRWRMIYNSLAGVSAVAAALIIVAGLWVINRSASQNRERDRVLAVRKAIDGMISADRPSSVDEALQDVNDSIDDYQNQTSTVALQDKDMHQLLSVLATLRSERDEIMPPPEPGSL
ncbi:MAG: hypothetical protein FWD61_19240 [Phycisphaerales bacterium]|nr:hypothetical protein [Phycisphaerales bacterium]